MMSDFVVVLCNSEGQSLPVNCLPTSSKPAGSASYQKGRTKPTSGRKQHTYSGKRRKEVIDALKEQNVNDYRPSPGSK